MDGHAAGPSADSSANPEEAPHNEQSGQPHATPPGGLGGAGLVVGGTTGAEFGARDTRLISKAIAKHWDIPEATFKLLPGAMLQIIANKAKSSRNRIMATKVLLEMNRQNADLDNRGVREPQLHLHAHAADAKDLERLRQEMLDDPAYLDYCRAQAIEVKAAPAPSSNGNGNGHGNGNGNGNGSSAGNGARD